MFFSAVVMSLVALVMSQAPTPYIDYESCYWDYAGDGENIECNDGYVGIGACGSLTGDTCNNNAEGIQCCLMKHGGMQTDCEWREGTSGEQVECTGDKLVHGVCGSGGFDSCGRNNDYTFSMQCCESPVIAIKSSACGWLYGGNGDDISCEEGRVMSGRCGSRNLNQCDSPSTNAHGAYCCRIEDR